MALKRPTIFSALFSNLIKPLRSTSVAPSAFRSCTTHSQVADAGGDDRSVVVDRRPDRSVARRPNIFPGDVFDPFSPMRSLSQVLNLVDQFMETPLFSGGVPAAAPSRRGWDVREDDEALYLRIDMPGLGKDDVRVSMEQTTLIIREESKKEGSEEEDEEEENARRYSIRLDLPPDTYKIDQIKAEMKNGVLKLVVPKLHKEERKDVVEVKVE